MCPEDRLPKLIVTRPRPGKRSFSHQDVLPVIWFRPQYTIHVELKGKMLVKEVVGKEEEPASLLPSLPLPYNILLSTLNQLGQEVLGQE